LAAGIFVNCSVCILNDRLIRPRDEFTTRTQLQPRRVHRDPASMFSIAQPVLRRCIGTQTAKPPPRGRRLQPAHTNQAALLSLTDRHTSRAQTDISGSVDDGGDPDGAGRRPALILDPTGDLGVSGGRPVFILPRRRPLEGPLRLLRQALLLLLPLAHRKHRVTH